VFVIFVSPLIRNDVYLFLNAMLDIPNCRVAVISQQGLERLPAHTAERLAAYRHLSDTLNPEYLDWAVGSLSEECGPVHRLLSVNEQSQLPVALVRAKRGIPGMLPDVAANFRDKAQMKDRFRQAGVPCARSLCAHDIREAAEFAGEVGFPLVAKPLDAAASQGTVLVDNFEQLAAALRANSPLQLEEFVQGEESTLEAMTLHGQPLWFCSTHYLPGPLDVLRNPWIQWRLLTPREPASPDVLEVGARALLALGMGTGLSHMEWFRRSDGTLAVGEIACRPPGPYLLSAINRAHDADLAYRGWSRLMVLEEFSPPPPARYAVGTATLRGQGSGVVAGVRGFEEVLETLGDLVVGWRVPERGEAANPSYDGDGFIQVRHPDTEVVAAALEMIVNRVRVLLSPHAS
jgi:hypothetical protein